MATKKKTTPQPSTQLLTVDVGLSERERQIIQRDLTQAAGLASHKTAEKWVHQAVARELYRARIEQDRCDQLALSIRRAMRDDEADLRALVERMRLEGDSAAMKQQPNIQDFAKWIARRSAVIPEQVQIAYSPSGQHLWTITIDHIAHKHQPIQAASLLEALSAFA